MDLPRWHQETSTAQGDIQLPDAAVLRRATGAVSFSNDQLLELGIDPDLLSPFVLPKVDRALLLTQQLGNTSLERCPLVRIGENLICALPNSISPAIRRFVVEELDRAGELSASSRALAEYQFEQVRDRMIWEFRDFSLLPNVPEPEGAYPSLHSWVINYDLDKLLHVLVIHGRLDSIKKHGFNFPAGESAAKLKGLKGYVATVANWCKSRPDCQEGTTVLVLGGLGEPSSLGLNSTVDDWHISAMNIADFRLVTSEDDQPITRYLKFIKQRALVQERGVEFFFLEDFALYCHWRQTDYMLVPRPLPLEPGSVFVQLGGAIESVCEHRSQVRASVDRHAIPTIHGGQFARVKRFHRNSVFETQRQKPIYANPDSVLANVVAGAIETKHGVSWLTAITRPGKPIMELPYRLWEGFIDLFERLVEEIDTRRLSQESGVIEVRLDCSDVEAVDGQAASEPIPTPSEPEIAIDTRSRFATIKLPAKFMHIFRQPENAGERTLVRSIARALIRVHGITAEDSENDIVESLTDIIASNSGIRVIHAFSFRDSLEILQQRKQPREIRFISQADYRFLNTALCEGNTAFADGDLLESRDECNGFLKECVVLLFKRIRRALQRIDRAAVIREMLNRKEAIIADRRHWARTAKAVLALHSESRDGSNAAVQRELQRASAGLAARSIIEMAICECPSEGGRQLSSWDTDELLATMSYMVDIGACSDAIYNCLAEPRIQLFANGEFDMDVAFQEQVLKPFLMAFNRSQFGEAAADYESLYDNLQPDTDETPDSELSNELVSAFQAEFGLTPRQAGRGVGELIELALFEQNLVIETTVGQIKYRLLENCQYSKEECEHFLRSFGLIHRPKWEVPPKGFSKRDIYPWRYGRRLSIVVKPLLLFGERDDDKVFYSASLLKDGFAYLVGKIRDGHLSDSFFDSKQMTHYIGSINDKLGRDFEKEVAAKLEDMQWNVRGRLRMSELGAPAELGDVDALAWKLDGQVYFVECKRLQFARTVAEIANVCERFRGEAQDQLGKHLRRLNWIIENAASLKEVIGFKPKVSQIDDRIVTSTQVPLSYLTSLPIEPSKFVSLSELRL